jgi:hypothetical protein
LLLSMHALVHTLKWGRRRHPKESAMVDRINDIWGVRTPPRARQHLAGQGGPTPGAGRHGGRGGPAGAVRLPPLQQRLRL